MEKRRKIHKFRSKFVNVYADRHALWIAIGRDQVGFTFRVVRKSYTDDRLMLKADIYRWARYDPT